MPSYRGYFSVEKELENYYLENQFFYTNRKAMKSKEIMSKFFEQAPFKSSEELIYVFVR